jgi:prevent-host-death family protein
MIRVVTITEAKAKFSELINWVIHNRQKIYVCKRGKNVAVITPPDEQEDRQVLVDLEAEKEKKRN